MIMMNPALALLQPYPFEKLAQLKSQVMPPPDRPALALSMGEPQHAAPEFILEALRQQASSIAKYPLTKGLLDLRQQGCQWLSQRFNLPLASLDPERHILPVNGTREALFAIAQCLVHPGSGALVLMPNPFYQIYEGAALLAGAAPYFLNTTLETGFLPDFHAVPPEVWQRCALIFVCSPGNPTGAVVRPDQWQYLLELSQRYQFVIAADECYSELYPDEHNPPYGLLSAAYAAGLTDYQNCLVFHSLSKRSNVPGLRSGLVAGDARLIQAFALYRTYHGCAMPYHHQQASRLAWADETHVYANRCQYREKFAAVRAILGNMVPESALRPEAGFYLWLPTPIADTDFAQQLYQRDHITVLPGSYLSRIAQGINPGENYIRVALVPPLAQCITAAEALLALYAHYQ